MMRASTVCGSAGGKKRRKSGVHHKGAGTPTTKIRRFGYSAVKRQSCGADAASKVAVKKMRVQNAAISRLML